MKHIKLQTVEVAILNEAILTHIDALKTHGKRLGGYDKELAKTDIKVLRSIQKKLLRKNGGGK